MLDWNWFFSSVAQSSAAIVGIFGAFLFSKIITNQAEYERKCGRMRDLRLAALRIVDLASGRYFNWYNERMQARELQSLAPLLGNEKELREPEFYYDRSNFSPFERRTEVEAIIRGLIEDERRRREEPRPSLLRQWQLPDMGPLRFADNSGASLIAEREEIDSVLVEAKHMARTIQDFVPSVQRNPESSSLITFSAISGLLLFFGGVIYPLGFMPIAQGATVDPSPWTLPNPFSLRGGILEVVAAIFSAVVVVFMAINARLKYSKSEVEELARYASLGAYSDYFVIHEQNAGRLASGKPHPKSSL